MSRNLLARLRNRVALLDHRGMVKLRLNAPVASFTFDDFPCSAYEAGGRILEAANLRGTYFLTGSFMGTTQYNGIKLYDENTLKAAYRAGHEIGCHSFSHNELGRGGGSFAIEDCRRNAAFVRDILGPDIIMTSFAYPYGDVSLAVKTAISGRFSLGRGVRQSLNSGMADMAQLRIVSLEVRHASQLNLAEMITTAQANNSWIVFLTHDVSDNPSPHGSTPAMLENTVKALTQAGIEILPLKAAAARAIHNPTIPKLV